MTAIENDLTTPLNIIETAPPPHLVDDVFHTSEVVTLSFAHGAHDMFFSFIPPLQPLLMEKLSLSHAQAGLFTFFVQGPSLFQPFIGHLADRRNLRIIIILAPILSSLALTLIGFAPNYGILALLMLIAGFSTAGFHAIAPVLVAARSGKMIGRGMGLFMVGGELGFSIGPLIVVAVVAALTLKGLPWLLSIGILCSLVLFFRLKNVTTLRSAHQEKSALPIRQMLLKMRSIMLPILAYIFISSFLQANIINFLPTYLKGEGASFVLAGRAFFIIEISGTAGVFFSSWISDRIGQRIILIISTLWVAIFSLLFLNTRGWLQILMLIGAGLLAFSPNPAFLSIVQRHFSENRSLANGLYMAANFVVRSIVVVLVGLLADQFGLRTVFTFSAWSTFLALPFVFFLPTR
jgi:FSR family fosmidomycin resistance protein-like MFS transporter